MNESKQESKKNYLQSAEFKIIIEKPEEFEESIFSDVYKSARQNVLKIIKRHESDDDTNNPSNNIIAFTGERGKGKSSAMISFHRALKSIQKGTREEAFFDEFYKGDEPKYRFITLGEIDPSLFRGKESLFEIVLAKMFGLFKESLESSDSSRYSDEDRRELVKHFQTVFENLKYTTGNHKDELYRQEALDALIKLSTSSNLRASFQKLIRCYLRVLGKQDDHCKNILVIAIDDFDLKIEGVYEMLEDVRQFLISQNIIILIACKMPQIRETIQASIYSSYLSQLGQNKELLESITSESELIGKAEKYVSKLIPLSRRILLPNIETIVFNKRLLLHEIPKQVFDQFKIYINPDLINAFYPETLREFNSFEKIAREDFSDPKQRIDYFKNYLIEKISNIKSYRNLSELMTTSNAKNFMIHFKRALQKILSDLNPHNDNFKHDNSTSSYPEIIRLYRELLNEIPKYENSLQKLVSLYRTYFNILHYEAMKDENTPYLKIDDRQMFFSIKLSADKSIKDLEASKPLIYSFGASKTKYLSQTIPSTVKHFELSFVNGILYDNADLAKYFNLDLVLKYYESFEKTDSADNEQSTSHDFLLIHELSASKNAAEALLKSLSFFPQGTTKDDDAERSQKEEENKSLEVIKELIEQSKFYQNFSAIKKEINHLLQTDSLNG